MKIKTMSGALRASAAVRGLGRGLETAFLITVWALCLTGFGAITLPAFLSEEMFTPAGWVVVVLVMVASRQFAVGIYSMWRLVLGTVLGGQSGRVSIFRWWNQGRRSLADSMRVSFKGMFEGRVSEWKEWWSSSRVALLETTVATLVVIGVAKPIWFGLERLSFTVIAESESLVAEQSIEFWGVQIFVLTSAAAFELVQWLLRTS